MAKPRSVSADRAGPTRCAIYTRKSTDDGLEQEFNSLDAQREACASYILSQRHEGWTLVPEHYDDGGFSGGNMERPGLKQLLADIAAGKVDVIVLYKVDRLTRSLIDFGKIVEVLDVAGASFVSVTQSLNTTTSMGRLMLNVLLSFAQFERENTGDRIRDKIAAAKAKGMWMGGPVPLGYVVKDRKLVIEPAEAVTVRHIFQRYIELGSIRLLLHDLTRSGITTKVRQLKSGRVTGGGPFHQGGLAHLLKNCTYVGRITHKGKDYPGEHAAIVDAATFDAVQALLATNRTAHYLKTNAEQPSLLTGMVIDGLSRRMTPDHTTKGAKRYRYYESRCQPGDPEKRWRLPAGEIERLVKAKLTSFLCDGAAICDALPPGLDVAQALAGFEEFGLSIPHMPPAALRTLLLRLGLWVTVRLDEVELRIASAALLEMGGIRTSEHHLAEIVVATPAQLKRCGQGMKLVVTTTEASAPAAQNSALISLIVRAHEARRDVIEGKPHSYSRAYLMTLLRLSYLAPDIVTAIVEGRQPAELTTRRLVRATNVPSSWIEQRRMFGFA